MRRRTFLAGGGWSAAWLAAGRPALSQLAAQPATRSGGAAEEAAVFDAAGFRRTRYRATVDRDPAPAMAVPLDRALRWHAGGDALFLDVLPADGARRDPATGAWRGIPAHATIPGARWFPEVGRSPPDALLWAGFSAAVRAVRARHPHWPVVVFCRADCWMSWNAARRLALAGVDGVFWLAAGIDGWHERHHPLAPARPEITGPEITGPEITQP